MNPERHQRIKEIFNAALEYPSDHRLNFVARECGDDSEIRREVESLLAAFEAPANPLDTPVAEVAAHVMGSPQPAAVIGRTLGHYKVEREIGRGGMGEVYLAKDLRLNRPVAMKLLPTDSAWDETRLRRFQQEARAASTLNHPHIVTIHEVGEDEGQWFIVSEYIGGQILREWAAGRKFDLAETLDKFIQVAGALSAAHKAGIIHRDIKPENIMVRPDGYVKVLDFGLAKLASSQAAIEKQISASIKNVTTTPGIVMGTVNYMSPEQARMQPVDHRSDIFSLGIVLYEMVAGRLPFAGESVADILSAIIKDEPTPLEQLTSGVPDELQAIVDRALKKEREERYQSVDDMLLDLQDLKYDLDLVRRQRRSPAQGIAEASQIRSDYALTAPGRIRQTSSAEYLFNEIKRHKLGVSITLTSLILIVAGSFAVYTGWFHHNPTTRISLDKVQFSKLTSSGKVGSSVISPDGKYLAYSQDDGGGNQSLWLRQLNAMSNRSVLPSSAVSFADLTFSPDGDYLLYSTAENNNPKRQKLYQIPILGGDARLLMSDLDGNLKIAPNGKELCLERYDSSTGSTEIIISDIKTGQQRLLTRFTEASFSGRVVWSPDGKIIACVVSYAGDDKQQYARIRLIATDSGQVVDWNNFRAYNISDIVWLPDGKGFYLVSSRGTEPKQISYVAYPSGEVQKVTNDLNNYQHLSLTSNGEVLVAEQSITQEKIWIVPKDTPTQARSVTSDLGSYSDVNWTPEGRLIFASTTTGKSEFWELGVDGSSPRQVTFDAVNKYEPVVCGGGKYIVYISSQNGRLNLWRINRSATGLMQLTDMKNATNPECSADGQWVQFRSKELVGSPAWRVPLEGGKPEIIDCGDCQDYQISPDGRSYAVETSDKDRTGSTLTIHSFDNSSAPKTLDLPPTYNGLLQWTPDSKGFTFVDYRSGSGEIYYLSLNGGEARKFTDFRSQRIQSGAWSPDGKLLAVMRWERTTDVVRITSGK